MNNKPEEFLSPAAEIPVLLKIGKYFIHAGQIRSASRFGKGCKITLTSGEELLITVSYDKIADLIGK